MQINFFLSNQISLIKKENISKFNQLKNVKRNEIPFFFKIYLISLKLKQSTYSSSCYKKQTNKQEFYFVYLKKKKKFSHISSQTLHQIAS